MRRWTVLGFLSLLAVGTSLSRGAEAPPNPEASAEERIETLEEKVRILERLKELEAEKAAEQAKAAVTTTAGRDGFSIKAADGSWLLQFRGYVQFDGRFFENGTEIPATDTFLLRRVRPIFEGTVGRRFDFKIMPDFGGGTTVLQEAYVDVKFYPWLKLRGGKFKAPVGLERLQSGRDLAFVERAFPTNLVPNRDLGVQLHGDIPKATLAWALGAFNGVTDGGSGDSDTDSYKDVAGRLFATPLGGRLGIGIAGSVGERRGTIVSTGLQPYRTPAQQIFFSYRIGATLPLTAIADGARTRVSPQAWVYVGPFSLMAEYAFSRQRIVLDTQSRTLENTAWQATVGVVLTGEKATYKGVTARRPYELDAKGPGAWELLARIERLDVDPETFPVYADPAKSAQRALAYGLGVNAWINRNLRWQLDLHHTRFEGGAAAGADRPDENVLLTRLQLSF